MVYGLAEACFLSYNRSIVHMMEITARHILVRMPCLRARSQNMGRGAEARWFVMRAHPTDCGCKLASVGAPDVLVGAIPPVTWMGDTNAGAGGSMATCKRGRTE